jgi:LysM repeat protein
MSSRRSARFLAPLALVIALLAVYYVVQHSDTSKDSASSSTTTTTKTAKGAAKPAKKKATPGTKTYTVQSGDTLSAIAEKTGVSADQISELNPNLDPQGLQVGEKVKLRP